MMNQYVRIMVFLGLIAVVCGTANAGMGIIAETQPVSSGSYPVCNAPCECISEKEASLRWGVDGYDRCNKNVCGQSENAMTQYYCFHQIGGVSGSSSYTTCQAPCECLSESGAISRWGAGGYTQCTKTACGQETTNAGTVSRYCFRQWGSTLVIGGSATAATTVTTQAAVQTQAIVQAPAQQTPAIVQQTVDGVAAQATATTVYTWPEANAVPQQRSPAGMVAVIAAIGTVILACAVKGKE